MKQYGHVDEQGRYFLWLIFDNHDPDDMDRMMSLLHDPEEEARVQHYDEEQVEVAVYPGF